MRTTATVVLAGLVLVFASSPARVAEPAFRSPEAALKQGLGAYRGGYYEIAVPALQYAADEDSLLAKYYLAQIYSDNLGSRTDHVRAFDLYRSIVDRYAGVDPDLDPRGMIVGQALTAYAKYVRTGLAELNLKANPSRARAYFHNASTTFNNEDAQFELAKMYLAGEGGKTDRRLARHWLSTLTGRGHPGAQAFLADLLWRGKHMKADPVRALALIAVAVKNAPPQERLWIEDIYQTIYCGAAKGVRRQATGIVADWGKRYGRKVRRPMGKRAMVGDARPIRTCQDGETVRSMWEPQIVVPSADNDGLAGGSAHPPPLPLAAQPGETPPFSLGGATGRAGSRPARSLRNVTTPVPGRR